jgi:hypothetical protein
MKRLAIAVVVSAAFLIPAQGQSYGQGWSNDYAQAKKPQKRAKQRVTKQRQVQPKPCVAYHWTGCLGWDPDPNVRAMILHDRNIYDD